MPKQPRTKKKEAVTAGSVMPAPTPKIIELRPPSILEEIDLDQIRLLLLGSEQGDAECRNLLDEIAKHHIHALAKAAVDQPSAARSLHLIISVGVLLLEGIGQSTPEALRSLAAHTWKWPGYISKHPSYARLNDSLMDALHLGAECPINVSAKAASLELPQNDVVHWLYTLITIERRSLWLSKATPTSLSRQELEALHDLPEYTRASAERWHRASLPLLHLVFGINFEDDPVFQSWKTNRRFDDYQGKAKTREIREDIKRSLKQAWRSIAKS